MNKKLKGKEENDSPPYDSTQFEITDPSKFCIKQMYRVVFFTQADDLQTHYLGVIANEGKKYEDISNVYFVLYKDIKLMITNPPTENIPLPKHMIPDYIALIATVEPYLQTYRPIPPFLLAKCIKMKIIMLMYDLYRQEVKKMFRRKALEEELAHLCDSKAQDTSKKGKKDKKAKPQKPQNAVKKELKEIDDYTTIPLEPNSEILEDNIYNQEMFYVLTGFIDFHILKELMLTLHVPVMAFIELNPANEITDGTCSGGLDRAELFWCMIKNSIYGHRRLSHFEDSALLEFNASGSDSRDTLKEFLCLIKSFWEVKLLHLNYLRSLRVYDVEEKNDFIPFGCFSTYSNYLESLAPELRTVPLVLNSALEEVCTRVYEKEKKKNECIKLKLKKSQTHTQQPDLNVNRVKSENLLCSCPFSINAFFDHKRRIKAEEKEKGLRKTYIVEKYDLVGNIAYAYGMEGVYYAEVSMNMLKTFLKSFVMRGIDMDKTIEYPHKHAKPQAPKTPVPDNQYQINHFMYLFLFASLQHLHPDNDDMIDKTDINKYFQVYSPEQEFNELCWNKFEDRTDSEILMSQLDRSDNMYQPTTINYHWVENLSPNVMMQKVYQANGLYKYMDKFYCDETETLLVQFHDYLTDVGLTSIMSSGHLRTPICLRDFCRYITVFEAKWLDKHRPPQYFQYRELEQVELCPGAKLINENKLYEEYLHLVSSSFIKVPQKEVNFHERLKEIMNYPNSTDLYKIYEEYNNVDNDFVAFNLGSNLLALRGGLNIFQSHDDVQVAVDTTRFMDDDVKCSVTVTSKNIVLHLFSSEKVIKEDYSYHFTLVDKTIITFTLRSKTVSEDVSVYSDFTISKSQKGRSTTRATPLSSSINDDTPNEQGDELYIKSVDNQYFQNKITENAIFESENVEEENEEVTPKVQIHEKNDPNFYSYLLKAVSEERPIYKVHKNYKYIKSVKPEVDVPLSTVLKRVMQNPISKSKYKFYNRKFHSEKNYIPKQKSNIDFMITLRNHLQISQCSSAKSSDKIKQQFIYKGPQLEGLEHEDYRIYCKTGNVLSKLKDGTIIILSHLGTIATFEKPIMEEGVGNSNIAKPCICLNTNSYRKKLQRIFKDEFKKNSKNYTSRRHVINQRKKNLLAQNLKAKEDFKIPYYKTSLINLAGKITILEGKRLRQSQKFFMAKEADYVLNTISYERTDGFKCLLFENGEIHVKFPDNTKIICWFEVAAEEVYGFVFISIGFKFEHPYYNTIHFNPDNSLSIPLPNNIHLKKLANEQFELTSPERIHYTIQSDWIKFVRECDACPGYAIGKVALSTFVNKRWVPTERLMKFVDSYGKIFYWDVTGKCTHNSGFKKGAYNQFNCCHYSDMEYKKLFLIKKDFSGQMLWTNYMSNSKEKNYQKCVNCDILYYESSVNREIFITDFRRKMYKSFFNYYNNMDIFDEQFCLDVYKKPLEREVAYETYLQIYTLLNEKIIQQFCVDLIRCLSHIKCLDNSDIFFIIYTMFEDTENYDTEIFKPRKDPVGGVSIPTCNCRKTFITMEDKNQLWRDQVNLYKNKVKHLDASNYFKSEYCMYNK